MGKWEGLPERLVQPKESRRRGGREGRQGGMDGRDPEENEGSGRVWDATRPGEAPDRSRGGRIRRLVCVLHGASSMGSLDRRSAGGVRIGRRDGCDPDHGELAAGANGSRRRGGGLGMGLLRCSAQQGPSGVEGETLPGLVSGRVTEPEAPNGPQSTRQDVTQIPGHELCSRDGLSAESITVGAVPSTGSSRCVLRSRADGSHRWAVRLT